MKRACRLAILVVLGMGLTAVGRADTTYTWNFATSARHGEVVVGGSSTFSYPDVTGNLYLPVHGYTTTNGPGSPSVGGVWTDVGTRGEGNLYNKYTSSLTDPETGLGFTSSIDSENEIVTKSFVQLDLLNLELAHLINPTITISSIQPNEGYYLWGSNTAGTPGLLLNTYINSTGATGANMHTVAFPGYPGYRYYSVSAAGNSGSNVLISNGFAGTATPEPGGVALLLGLIVPAGLLLRRRSK